MTGHLKDNFDYIVYKGCISGPNLMNFRKTSKQPLTPPTLFSENNVALFATKFFGVQWPHPFSLPKNRNKIFRIGNDLPPPSSEVFRKFIKFGPGRRPLWTLLSTVVPSFCSNSHCFSITVLFFHFNLIILLLPPDARFLFLPITPPEPSTLVLWSIEQWNLEQWNIEQWNITLESKPLSGSGDSGSAAPIRYNMSGAEVSWKWTYVLMGTC